MACDYPVLGHAWLPATNPPHHHFFPMDKDAINQLISLLQAAGTAETPAAAAASAAVPASSASPYSDKHLLDLAAEYIDFTYDSPTTFHVVANVSSLLAAAGFTYVSEKSTWDLAPGKYFTTRNSTSLVAFTIGAGWKPEYGAGAVGGHIDALATKLKPNSTKTDVDGYELLGVAPYAGALSDLWWDRDLGIGGRVLVKSKTGVEAKLINSAPHPIARIPTLAPHFGTPAVGPFNKETQAVPVVGFSKGPAPTPTKAEESAPLYGKHSLKLLRYVAKLAGVAVEEIVQVDLDLFDVQKGTFGGLEHEFLYAPRIDDRICLYAAIKALVAASESGPADKQLNLVGLFDNEELGSLSRQGAQGHLLQAVIERVTGLFASGDVAVLAKTVYANSLFLLSDVNHLLNPNFANVYLEHHKPVPNTGVTIALDLNGHMATDAVGLAIAEELARRNGDLVQYFQIRNDSRSGGTIGPYILSQSGARTIDLGIPQLSMHSIRAATGSKDFGLGVKYFHGFFDNWRAVVDSYGDL